MGRRRGLGLRPRRTAVDSAEIREDLRARSLGGPAGLEASVISFPGKRLRKSVPRGF